MKFFFTLLLFSGVFVAFAQEQKDITTKNFEKKYSSDCKLCFVKYENDAFTKKVVGETHKIQTTQNDNAFFSIDRNDRSFVIRVYDTDHDVRNYDVCKFLLQTGDIITLGKAVKLGHKSEGKKTTYSRDFPVSKSDLEKIKTSGFKGIRLEYELKKTFYNYEVPAENETIGKFILNCILAN